MLPGRCDQSGLVAIDPCQYLRVRLHGGNHRQQVAPITLRAKQKILAGRFAQSDELLSQPLQLGFCGPAIAIPALEYVLQPGEIHIV